MIFIRSVIFFVIFIILTLFLSIFMTITTIIRNKKLLCNVTVIWAKSVIFFLKIICGINYRVEGIKNLPDDDQNYLVVSKHQSTWETYFLYYFFPPKRHFQVHFQLCFRRYQFQSLNVWHRVKTKAFHHVVIVRLICL